MIGTLRLYSIYPFALAAGATLTAGLVYWLLRSQRKTPEQRERERRQRIAAMGRITDGTVVDVCEVPAEGKGNGHAAIPAQMLIFHYDVAGVTYEASQDITQLRHFIDLHTCRVGLHTSVKYDPQNPGNSIVIAEEWTGLRR